MFSFYAQVMKPLQDPSISSENVQNAVNTKSIQYPYKLWSCCNRITEPIHPGESPGRPLFPPAGFPPERIVNVQINVQSVDEELPISRVNTDGLTEMLTEQVQSVKSNAKTPIFYLSKIEMQRHYSIKLKR